VRKEKEIQKTNKTKKKERTIKPCKMLPPKIKIEKHPLRDFFGSDPFLIKDPRVVFSPN